MKIELIKEKEICFILPVIAYVKLEPPGLYFAWLKYSFRLLFKDVEEV